MTAFEQRGRSASRGAGRSRGVLLAGLIAAAGLLLFVLANTHLVYIAVTSQPDCIPHRKAGEGASDKGLFSAAKPAC